MLSVDFYTWNHEIITVRSSTHTPRQQKMSSNKESRLKILISHTTRLICIALYTISLTFALIRIYKHYHRETPSRPISPCTKSPTLRRPFCFVKSQIMHATSRNVIADITHYVNFTYLLPHSFLYML